MNEDIVNIYIDTSYCCPVLWWRRVSLSWLATCLSTCIFLCI